MEPRQDPSALAYPRQPAPEDELEAALEAGHHRRAVLLLAERHGPAVGRLCMALVGDQGDAEDLLQETLVAAHDGLATFRQEASPRSWLYGIARRKCAQFLTRHRRRRQLLEHAEAGLAATTDGSPAADPASLLEKQERARRARRSLGRLKPSERELLALRFSAELSYREVGEILAIDEATARKRVSRALERLRAQLAEHES